MDFPFGETITRLRGVPVMDPYSTEATDLNWEAPDALDIRGVGVEPRPSSEPTQDARNATISGFTLYLPPKSDVTPADRLVVRGKTYDVEGEPADWVNPFTGWTPGMVVQTKVVEG